MTITISARVDVHVHAADAAFQKTVLAALAGLKDQGQTIMHTLDEVAQDMTEQTTLIDGISSLITGLKQQVADALSGAALPPAVQAKVDAIFDQAEANKVKLTAAAGANTDIPPAAVNAPPVA